MRIGELAARAGVPTKTIRYYEDIGLLAPPKRTPAGYRDYDNATVERLAFIRAAHAVALSLGEIRSITALRDNGETPCEHVLALLQRRAEDLDARIAELEKLRNQLRRLARRARDLDPVDCNPAGICHLIERSSKA